MNVLASAVLTRSVGDFTIGAADIDARAQGVATVGKGDTIKGFQVLSGGPGDLYYVDDLTGATCHLSGLSSTSGDIEPTAGPLAIRTIFGTGSGTPSAAFTLRATW